MRGSLWAIAGLGFLIACGPDAARIPISVSGRVVNAFSGGQGVAGVTVRCPASGGKTTTDADGRFVLKGSVPARAEGKSAAVAVWFEKAGWGSVPRPFLAIEGVETTLVAVLDKAAVTREVKVPAPGAEVSIASADTLANAFFTLRSGSLADAAGSVVTGTVQATVAGWQSTLPPFGLSTPVLPDVAALDGTSPYLRVVAVGQFEAAQDGALLSVASPPGVGMELTTPLDAPAATDNRVFRVDPSTGLLVEKPSGTVSLAENKLVAVLDEPGTWVWARPWGGASTCVDVAVKDAAGAPVVGAQVRLIGTILNQDITILDERVAAEGGSFCLRGPVGQIARVQVLVAGADGVSEQKASNLTLSGTGDCGTGCPQSVTIEMP